MRKKLKFPNALYAAAFLESLEGEGLFTDSDDKIVRDFLIFLPVRRGGGFSYDRARKDASEIFKNPDCYKSIEETHAYKSDNEIIREKNIAITREIMKIRNKWRGENFFPLPRGSVSYPLGEGLSIGIPTSGQLVSDSGDTRRIIIIDGREEYIKDPTSIALVAWLTMQAFRRVDPTFKRIEIILLRFPVQPDGSRKIDIEEISDFVNLDEEVILEQLKRLKSAYKKASAILKARKKSKDDGKDKGKDKPK